MLLLALSPLVAGSRSSAAIAAAASSSCSCSVRHCLWRGYVGSNVSVWASASHLARFGGEARWRDPTRWIDR